MFSIAPASLHLLDLVLMAILLFALPAWDHFVDTPKVKQRLEAGTFDPMQGYVSALVILWSLTLLLAIDWWTADRSPKLLGLMLPQDLRFALGCLFIAMVIALFIWQYFKIRGLSLERKRKVMDKDGRVFITPSTPRQLLWFMGVSVTAGVTEELLYRGFLIWALAAYMSVILAALLASALFGLSHAYQGRSGILKTGAYGLIMAILYIGSGSILLPILLHAFVDAHNGLLMYSLKLDLEASSPAPSTEPV